MPRLFFALWPDEAARAILAPLAKRTASAGGGRAVPAANLHLTLVFLGDVPHDRIGLLSSVASTVRMSAFDLSLDRTGTFRRTGVAWAGPSTVPPALEALQRGLDRALRDAGFALEERPFVPHLTLARKLRTWPPAGPFGPAAWRVDGFSLVESARESGAYRDIGRWKPGREI